MDVYCSLINEGQECSAAGRHLQRLCPHALQLD